MKKSTDLLDEIRKLPKTRLAVSHEPETPRYSRARLKLRYLLERGTLLGILRKSGRSSEIEIAVWAAPEEGRGAGYYGCVKAFLGGNGEVLSAVLFCFYDGTEGSPAITSQANAWSYAKHNGYEEGTSNG